MNRLQAKKIVENMLHYDFQYIFQEVTLANGMTHLTFKMDSNLYDLQMTLEYTDSYLDVLIFVNLICLTDNAIYDSVLSLVNNINAYIKSFGRFYIDDSADIAYSLRFGYEKHIAKMSKMVLDEIEGAIKIYEDVFLTIISVAQGKTTYQDAHLFINDMWG